MKAVVQLDEILDVASVARAPQSVVDGPQLFNVGGLQAWYSEPTCQQVQGRDEGLALT